MMKCDDPSVDLSKPATPIEYGILFKPNTSVRICYCTLMSIGLPGHVDIKVINDVIDWVRATDSSSDSAILHAARDQKLYGFCTIV